MCINYKPLNKQCSIPLTVLPSISTIVRKMAAFKFKTRIDLHVLFNTNIFVYLNDILITHDNKNCLLRLSNNCLSILRKVQWEVNIEKSCTVETTMDILGYKDTLAITSSSPVKNT